MISDKNKDCILIIVALVTLSFIGYKYIDPNSSTIKEIPTQQLAKPTPSPIQESKAPEDQRKSKITDAEILVEIENRLNEYKGKLKGHYPSDNMLKTLSEDSSKLFILETGYAKPDNESQKKMLSKVKTLSTKVDVLRRDVYAKTLERAMLEMGINAEVQAMGEKRLVLEYKYALMSKATVYKLTNEGDALKFAKNIGFTKLIFTDGFNSSWTYDLTKKE